MATASIGGLIKDYRLQKRLSQLEISLSIGWSDTTRLSKIEQGRVGKPTRETVEKIIKALGLTEQEKGEFLLVGGYLPTEVEIRKMIKQVGPMIDGWSYPAYILDFTWRLVYINELGLKMFKLDSSWLDKIKNSQVNVLSFPFLTKDQFPVEVEQGDDKKSLATYAITQIASFKKENHKFQHEGWYNKLIQQLMQYDQFRKLWPKIDEKHYFKYKKLSEYEYKKITGVYNGQKKTLEFHEFLTRLYDEPRFMDVLYIPANKAAAEFCKL